MQFMIRDIDAHRSDRLRKDKNRSISLSPPKMSSIAHLYELQTIRERCQAVAASKLQYWTVDDAALPSVVEYVLKLIKRDYGTDYASIRPHGRWSHFLAAGKDRIEPLLSEWKEAGVDEMEIAKRMIDLTVASVLLDAGAGIVWKYTEEDGTVTARSEGLAVASLDMFKTGLFSSDKSNTHQVDAEALSNVNAQEIVDAMQVGKGNEMPGAKGRADVLVRLGQVLQDPENSKYFKGKSGSPRPGNMIGDSVLLELCNSS